MTTDDEARPESGADRQGPRYRQATQHRAAAATRRAQQQWSALSRRLAATRRTTRRRRTDERRTTCRGGRYRANRVRRCSMAALSSSMNPPTSPPSGATTNRCCGQKGKRRRSPGRKVSARPPWPVCLSADCAGWVTAACWECQWQSVPARSLYLGDGPAPAVCPFGAPPVRRR